MYLSFFKLKKKPFQISTDPEFLWLGEKHKEALATLKYGILDNKGFLLLTGDVGTGKTTLINALVSSLGDEVIVARVPDPGMEKMDLMNFISHSFDMGKEFVRKDLFLVHFGHFLNTAYTRRKKVLLIIDEAQRMSQDLLEEVRQLTNIERQETKLLNIFLIGQNEFNEMLLQEQNRALLQRITMNYNLERLDRKETGELVKHRLKVAGSSKLIFTSDALAKIYTFTKGTPRKINILCDHCLISGFVKGKRKIDSEMVEASADELTLPVTSAPVDIGDLLPDDDLYDDEGDLLVDVERNELPTAEQDEMEAVETANNAVAGNWASKAVAAVMCLSIVFAYIHFSKGIDDPAYRIKEAGRQLFSVITGNGKLLSENKQDIYTDSASTIVRERPPKRNDSAGSGPAPTFVKNAIYTVPAQLQDSGERNPAEHVNSPSEMSEQKRAEENTEITIKVAETVTVSPVLEESSKRSSQEKLIGDAAIQSNPKAESERVVVGKQPGGEEIAEAAVKDAGLAEETVLNEQRLDMTVGSIATMEEQAGQVIADQNERVEQLPDPQEQSSQKLTVGIEDQAVEIDPAEMMAEEQPVEKMTEPVNSEMVTLPVLVKERKSDLPVKDDLVPAEETVVQIDTDAMPVADHLEGKNIDAERVDATLGTIADERVGENKITGSLAELTAKEVIAEGQAVEPVASTEVVTIEPEEVEPVKPEKTDLIAEDQPGQDVDSFRKEESTVAEEYEEPFEPIDSGMVIDWLLSRKGK